jgi:hypothetical protein
MKTIDAKYLRDLRKYPHKDMNNKLEISDHYIDKIIEAVSDVLDNKEIPITARVAIAEKYIEAITFKQYENDKG